MSTEKYSQRTTSVARKSGAGVAVIIDLDEVCAARTRFARVAALRVARVGGDGFALVHDAPCVDVAQRPVVHARLPQVVDAARRVRRMAAIAANVGMQQPNGERTALHLAESERKVARDIARGVADSVHDCAVWLVREYRHALPLPAEAVAALGVSQPCLPAVKRVMVAVADERADARRIEPPQTVDELELRAQARVVLVVHVAGDEQRVRTFADAQVDDVVVCAEGSLIQFARNSFRGGVAQTLEWAVKVQVCGVYESELRHRSTAQGTAYLSSPP